MHNKPDETTPNGLLRIPATVVALFIALHIVIRSVFNPSLNESVATDRRASKGTDATKPTLDPVMTPQRLLKQIMLELLYPAVLGTVLFFTLDVVSDAVNSIFARSPSATFDAIVSAKCALLFVTVVFYSCDYAYIILTRHFEIAFFVYDCVFLVGLYLTLLALKVREGQLSLPPINWAVAVLYALFLTGYLSWDVFELHRAEDAKEQEFYARVIRWEIQSLFLTVASVPIMVWLGPGAVGSVVLFAVLLFVTIRFLFIVKDKRTFARGVG